MKVNLKKFFTGVKKFLVKAKKYLVVGSTLAILCGTAALLIGVTDYFTAPKIKENEAVKLANSLKVVYPSATKTGEANPIEDGEYCSAYYVAYKDETELGYIYKASGTNQFGVITLLAGISDSKLDRISLLSNGQTLASTLVDGYVTPLNNGTAELDDVSCGATFGAKLIRSMVNEAIDFYKAAKGVK